MRYWRNELELCDKKTVMIETHKNNTCVKMSVYMTYEMCEIYY